MAERKTFELGEAKWYYCPSCGELESERDVLYGHPDHRYCRRCGGLEVVDTGQTYDELEWEALHGAPYDCEKVREYIREKYVYHNPQFNPEKSQERIKYEKDLNEGAQRMVEEARRADRINHKNEVKCPWCGSTQIQMVPRKWSLLTGFLTNKVDRVCVNCKKKF